VATVESLVAHVHRLVGRVPVESNGVAVSQTTDCSITHPESGLTAPDATGAGGGGGGARVDWPSAVPSAARC